uniref:T9SS type A sorting domain-containing protein n=1 Tax=uncultured Winogradskyella sp. TaxID=395353 RepID=UPI0030EC9D2A
DGTAINTFNFTKGTDDWDPFPELLSVNNYDNLESSVLIKAYDQKLHFSNITSKTLIKVYNITGALVANLDTVSDTSIDIADGIWIVKIQANDGNKVVKLISH